MEHGITKNEVISALAKSPHGKLMTYVPLVQRAATEDPEFLAHVIAWDAINGQIRDSKIGLPVASLPVLIHDDFVENSLAHLGLLGPRELERAFRFSLEVRDSAPRRKSTDRGAPRRGQAIRRVVERYLRVREANYDWWESVCLQHRRSMANLYALSHTKPMAIASDVLFKQRYPLGSRFDLIARLKDMSPQEAAATITQRRIPFLIAVGALGPRAKDPDTVLAIIESMSPTELVTNTAMLEKLGIKTNPALRGAFDAALAAAASSKKTSALKATRAAAAVKDDKVRAKLQGAQEKQLDRMSVEGDWLVAADCSSSMNVAIEASRHVAATLARLGKGAVHLVFFNESPRYVNATGQTYDALLAKTKHVGASGWTSIGCAMQCILDKGLNVDGIVVVSDGGENRAPWFHTGYQRYAALHGKEPPVYLYWTRGDASQSFQRNMQASGLDLQVFDIRDGVDYHSLPNLVATMSTRRYGLVDQIMETRLLTLDEVFKERPANRKEKAHAR